MNLLLTFRKSLQVWYNNLSLKFDITNFDKELFILLICNIYVANGNVEVGYGIIKILL